MITYVFETIPAASGMEKARRFEYAQKISDPPLRTDPAIGLPVKRRITGGLGFTGLAAQHSCVGGCNHE